MKHFESKDVTSFKELLDVLLNSEIDYDLELIRSAYEYAATKHLGQIRLSGSPVEHHLLTVAKYIIDLKLDTVSVCAALLHDVIDKAEISIDEIDAKFGTEIAYIVSGLSDIRNLSKNFKEEDKNLEEFKNLIFKSSEDIRIIIIRLAEKLHNIQHIDQLEESIQQKAAKKILNIYAPIASYLGLGSIQRKLEDTSFRILHPKEYEILKSKMESLTKGSEELVDKFIENVEEIFKKYKFKYESFYGREKGIYSAYKKIKNKYLKGKDLEQYEFKDLKDALAFRIIVDNVEKCYIGLGLLHSKLKYSKDDFRDYISNPKENGYKSIHTILEFEDTFVEVQIRTTAMHEYNEFGPASHIAYKLMGESKSKGSFTWTKDLVGWKQKNVLSKEDFKVMAFKESIFVFTPKGLVIQLCKDATPLDFAFRIHTDIGYRYQGALVNGEMKSMNFRLKTGDIVEILTSKKPNVSADWVKNCSSEYTKSRIRRWFR